MGERGPRDLIERILKPFVSAHDGAERISLAGPEITLEPEQAQSLGLMLQELATNAMKYGALSADGGRIAVSWEPLLEGAGLKLRWRETGGPPVVPPKARGFGSLFIERLLAHDINGEAHLDFHQDGVICDVELRPPLART